MTKKDREAMRVRINDADWDDYDDVLRTVEREVDRAVRKARREERVKAASREFKAWNAGREAGRAFERMDAKMGLTT